MSFYHILPSNTSPETFPNNHASEYSTPITNAHQLNGNWEVALVNATHSNCINSFNNDTLTIQHKKVNLTQITKPVSLKVTLPTKGHHEEHDDFRRRVVEVLRLETDSISRFRLVGNPYI